MSFTSSITNAVLRARDLPFNVVEEQKPLVAAETPITAEVTEATAPVEAPVAAPAATKVSLSRRVLVTAALFSTQLIGLIELVTKVTLGLVTALVILLPEMIVRLGVAAFKKPAEGSTKVAAAKKQMKKLFILSLFKSIGNSFKEIFVSTPKAMYNNLAKPTERLTAAPVEMNEEVNAETTGEAPEAQTGKGAPAETLPDTTEEGKTA